MQRVHPATTLAVALVLVAPAARADVKSVWLGVKGATCPKCGFGLAKALHAVPGVEKAWIVVTPQHMEVRLKPGAWVDPAQMLQLTHKSNLKDVPEDIRLTVTGTLEKRGEGLVLVLDRMKTPVDLTLTAHASAPDRGTGLGDHVGELLEVEGYWPPDGKLTLAVARFKSLTEPGSQPGQTNGEKEKR
jgi:hypothetical protein